MGESDLARQKRLYMRSIRRGIKEMDLILGGFAQRHLPGLSARDLLLYDALLSENDHDIYQWVTGFVSAPDTYAELIETIAQDAGAR